MNLRPLLFCTLLLPHIAAYAHGDVAEHIDILSKEYAQQPSDEVLLRRARLYIDQGNARQARKDLNRVLDLAPERHEAWYYLAQAQLMLNQPAQALEAIEFFLARTGSDAGKAQGLVVKGDAQLAGGKALVAGQTYVEALALEAEANPEHVLKAVDAFHAGGSVRALEVLADGIHRLGPLVSLQERGYAIEMETGRYQQALARIEQMLAGGQRLPQLLYKKAQTLQALQRPEEARQNLQAALAEIDQLPEGRRNTPALLQLQDAIRKALTG